MMRRDAPRVEYRDAMMPYRTVDQRRVIVVER